MQWRDFIALADVRRTVAAACEEAAVAPGTYNLGSGTPMTVRDMAGLVQDAFEAHTGSRARAAGAGPGGPGAGALPRVRGTPGGQGLRAETPVEEAVRETVQFCIEHKEALKTWLRSTT